MQIVVNISDARASRDADATLVTFSLGSCIGVTVYDPVTRVGGMLHYQLPESKIDPERARRQPLMFADTGLAWLLQEVAAHGAERKRLKVRIAGAAQMLNDANLFNIGRRNHAAIRKLLYQNGLFVEGEDVGGSSPRNLYLDVADGQVVVKTQGKSFTL